MKEFKSFFKVVGGNEGTLCKYPARLDTYGCGCSHDCSYCYAKSLLSFRGLWDPKNPRVASVSKIRKVIGRMKPGTIVRLGGMTDCFQPTERYHKVTRATISMLNRARVGYLIVTKSHIVADDEYRRLLDPELAHVQVTVTNTDDKAALKYEKCSLSSKRLAAMKTLQDDGIDCALRLSPYIKGFISPETIDRYKPKKIVIEFLRVNHWTIKWLGNLIDLLLYTLKHGGYLHLPLEEKIKQVNELKDALPESQFTVCEDVPEHWHYWRDNVNVNKEDCCNLS